MGLAYTFLITSYSGGDENFVENKGLLDYSKLSEPGSGEVSKPKSLAVSEFHFILLIGDMVKVWNFFFCSFLNE